MTPWDPTQYQHFADERLRPAVELLQRIPVQNPKSIYDLGCGTGDVTRLLAARFPDARIYGVDSSPAMLESAQGGGSAVEWREAKIEEWSPDEPPDLIYSNAALHWLEGHVELFPRLLGYLRAGGCLAVQMPLSWHAPSHQLLRETLANGGSGGQPLGSNTLRKALEKPPVADAATYYDRLFQCADTLDIWETEYLHILHGNDPVLEWVKGTALRPVLDDLSQEEREAFLDNYRRQLRRAYLTRENGCTPYPFRRVFIVAVVGSS